MGLITKTVIMKWNRANKKWYESKGYVYSKMGDEFDVKVEDLQINSTALVQIICDNSNCKNHIIKTIKWQVYKRYLHEDNKYYCNSCAIELFAKEKIHKTRLLNGKSFYDWCIEHNRQDVLARWDYELNDCSPKDICYSTNKKYYFKCPRGIHPSELKSISHFTSEQEKNMNCKMCNSFYQWCYDNLDEKQADEIMARWDEEKNGCNPKDINYGTNKKFWFKCPRNIHPSELKTIISFTSGHKKAMDCCMCNSFAQHLINTYGENALQDYWDYEKNNALGLDPWEISYGSGKKIWIFCQEKDYHGSYLVGCNHFNNKRHCPYCCNHNGKIHYLDSLGYLYPEVIPIWSKKNKKTPFEYAPNSGKSVWWKCLDEKHEDYKRQIKSSNDKNFRCPKCVQERDESILQEKTRLYLEKLGYKILHEHSCTLIPINPKTKHPLPFDNDIKLINGKRLIIEVHGIQHYQLTNFHNLSAKKFNTTPEYELHYIQVKDRYKSFVSYKNGYEYLELPYWTDDKDETWKRLIDNKINEILIKY